MEEQLLFARIHDALDIETPAGAYERLRTELTKKPVRPRRWPVLQTRFSKMGFRLAAGLAIVAIAVAAAAAVLAVHNATINSSPAGSRMSIQAYQKMLADDNDYAVATYSSPCAVGVHSGCAADATRAIPVVQKWILDVSRPDIPTKFTVFNTELRQHLVQNLTAQRDLLSASQRGDGPGMDRAYIIAVYTVDWTSTVIPLVYTFQAGDVTRYKNSVAAQQQSLNGCVSTCTLLASNQGRICTKSGATTCAALFDEVAPKYATFSATLVHYSVPNALSDMGTRLESDLAAANTVLLTMRLAVAANDQAGINSGIDQLLRLATRIDQDANNIIRG